MLSRYFASPVLSCQPLRSEGTHSLIHRNPMHTKYTNLHTQTLRGAPRGGGGDCIKFLSFTKIILGDAFSSIFFSEGP